MEKVQSQLCMSLKNSKYFLQALNTLCNLIELSKTSLSERVLKIKMHRIITGLIEDLTLQMYRYIAIQYEEQNNLEGLQKLIDQFCLNTTGKSIINNIINLRKSNRSQENDWRLNGKIFLNKL